MDLEKLEDRRITLLHELHALEHLQNALASIEKYNHDNLVHDELEIVSRSIMPYFEDINVNKVDDRVSRVYDDLMLVSNELNQMKDQMRDEIAK